MSFWAELGKEPTGEFDAGGGSMEVIPNETGLMAIIDEAKIETLPESGVRFVSLRWSVMKPDTYKNRKIFQKLWVFDLNPRTEDKEKAKKKRDKDRRMLAAIDHNAGGKLTSVDTEPTTMSLTSALLNKPMFIKVFVWEQKNSQTGEQMKGNWVGFVAPRSKFDEDAKPAAEKVKRDIDDEIPF